MRYNRNYQLTIQTDQEKATVIEPPFNINFVADKSVDKSLNKMNISIYNLSLTKQLSIVKNANEKKNFEVSLKIGYQDSLESIFRGYINSAEKARNGADTELILECIDGGFDARFSFTSKTIKNKPIIDSILEDMPNTRKGKITPQVNLTRPRVLVGNSWQLIKENTNQTQYYIDDSQLNILQENEVTNSFIPIVQSSTGLISSPTNNEGKVTFQTMMNPSLKAGGLCQINSKYSTDLNGIYKINTISYNGEYEGSAWNQSVTCKLTKDFKVL